MSNHHLVSVANPDQDQTDLLELVVVVDLLLFEVLEVEVVVVVEELLLVMDPLYYGVVLEVAGVV